MRFSSIIFTKIFGYKRGAKEFHIQVVILTLSLTLTLLAEISSAGVPIVNLWNSMASYHSHVVNLNRVNSFKTNFDNYWCSQDVHINVTLPELQTEVQITNSLYRTMTEYFTKKKIQR